MKEIYIAHCLLIDGEESFAFDDPVNFMNFMATVSDFVVGLATEVVIETPELAGVFGSVTPTRFQSGSFCEDSYDFNQFNEDTYDWCYYIQVDVDCNTRLIKSIYGG